MTKEKIDREEAAKVKIFAWLILTGFIMFAFIIAQNLNSDEMVHKFKSPSFSGIGTSAHYLTIENQQYTRKMTVKAELKAIQDEIERDKENTTLARFIRNLESRIYAQLSRQLVENLFGDTASDSGVLELEGNRIEYNVVDGIITLNITDSDGNEYYEVDYLAQDLVYDGIRNTNINDPNNYLNTDAPYILKTKSTNRRFITRFLNNQTLQIQFGSGKPLQIDE